MYVYVDSDTLPHALTALNAFGLKNSQPPNLWPNPGHSSQRHTPFFALLGRLGLFSSVFLFSSHLLFAKTPTALLVDKKTNSLHVCQHVQGRYQILKTYHATLGQVQGDKEEEDDLKTPEGIYIFTSLRRPPHLQKKFGIMGLHINFPNAFDHIAGRTGSNILLHATNEPERLKQNYDSQGCVVVNNQEILEIQPQIRLGLTPLLIFAELTPEYLKPSENKTLQDFFNQWTHSWSHKEMDPYIGSYHSDFTAQGKNKAEWKLYKQQLNSRYSSIDLQTEDVLFYTHPKYSMITFTQNYRSKLHSGHWGHRSRGTKILYIAEEHSQPKIIAETYTQVMW